MYSKLYLERWLLLLKRQAVSGGLDAHVRALDRKGGKWLALAVAERRPGGQRAEFRYRKRLTGPAMVAAATGADIADRVRAVHESVLSEHRGLLENGLRRFLRRSMRLLQALSDDFRGDAGLTARLETALRALDPALRQAKGGPLEARPAAAARKRAGKGCEIVPAASLITGKGQRLVAILDGRLLELAALVPRPAKATQRKAQEPGEPSWALDLAGDIGVEALGEWGLELLGVGSEGGGRGAAMAGADLAGAVAEAGGGADLGGIAEAGGGLAEAGAGLAQGAVEAAGAATEVIAESGSALANASCSGVDCGAVDCGGIDCVPG